MSNKIFKSLIIATTFVLITNSYLFIRSANLGGLWVTPIQISPNSVMGSARYPQIAFDCNGNAVSVWQQDDPSGRGRTYYNRYNAPTSSWLTTTTSGYISPDSVMGDAQRPQIAIDCQGKAIAVWTQFDLAGTGTARIYASQYDPSTNSWQTTTSSDYISNNGIDGGSNLPQIAFDCQSNAIAVWQQYDYNNTGTTRIYYNRYNASTEMWGTAPATPISDDFPGEDDAANPQIAFSCQGKAIAVWQQFDNDQASTGTQRIYANQYDSSTNSWQTTANQISSNSTLANADSPQIAIDCQGNAFAIWRQNDGTGIYRIYVNRYNASSGWQTALNLTPNFTVDFHDPQIAIDCKGNAIAVWNHVGIATVYASRYDAASMSWQANPVAISSASGLTGPAQIAFDCQGNALVIWSESDDSNYRIYANRYDVSSGSWLGATLVSTAGVNAYAPQVAIDCQGNAMAVWMQSDGEVYSIYAAYFDAVPAPSNIQGCQELHRFPTQSDLIYKLTFDPVLYENPIVTYKIYGTSCVEQEPCCPNCCNCLIRCCTCPCVNACLIGEVNASFAPVFYHHGRCCGQCITYCLTAVDSQGNETPVPSSITIP